MGEERRHHKRVPVQLDGHWKSPKGGGLCRIVNLSMGGCLVKSSGHPAESDETIVTFYQGKGGGAMSLSGNVVHFDNGGFGLKFRQLTPELKIQLTHEIGRLSHTWENPHHLR